MAHYLDSRTPEERANEPKSILTTASRIPQTHWHTPTRDDLTLSDDGTELHIHLGAGEAYVWVMVEDIKWVLENYGKEETWKSGPWS